MTDQTVPLQRYKGWEPTTEGVSVAFKFGRDDTFTTEINLIEVRELRDDMEEANMLARGAEKVECMASEVQQFDKIICAGNLMMVSDVLTSRGGTVLQFGTHLTEITMPSDDQITVWRAVE